MLGRIRYAVLWDDDRVDVVVDGVVLILSSDAAQYTLYAGSATPRGHYTALPLQAHRPALRAALLFRTTFCPRSPAWPSTLGLPEGTDTFTWPAAAPLRVVKWRAEDPDDVSVAPDGSIALRSSDGLATLTLAPHAHLFTVRWPSRLQTEVPEPRDGARATYHTVDQCFSTWRPPDRWAYPLRVAFGVWRSRHPEAEAADLPLIGAASGPWGLTELPHDPVSVPFGAALPPPGHFPSLSPAALCALSAAAHMAPTAGCLPTFPGHTPTVVLTPTATYRPLPEGSTIGVTLHRDGAHLHLRYPRPPLRPTPLVLYYRPGGHGPPLCIADPVPEDLRSGSRSHVLDPNAHESIVKAMELFARCVPTSAVATGS